MPWRSPFIALVSGGLLSAVAMLPDAKAGAYVHREGRLPNAPYMDFVTGRRCAQVGGFTLHANVRIHGSDHERLERLCRYVARGSVAQDRLRLLKDERVDYRLRRAYQDGTKAMIFEPLTFIEKLCALVPPPRQHLVTYRGVPAPNARFRDQVIQKPQEGSVRRRVRKNPIPLESSTEEEKRRRYTFAELMRRVFDVEVLRCRQCQGKRELVAMITEAPVIRAILECLKLPTDPPAIAGARWPKGLFSDT